MDGRDEVYWLKATITTLQARVGGLEYELRVRDIRLAEQDRQIAELERRVEELKRPAVGPAGAPAGGGPALPAFVKPTVPRRRRRRKPGRADGHEAALRPMPRKIDHHQDVPLPADGRRRPLCPHCNCRLTEPRPHRRLVQDPSPS